MSLEQVVGSTYGPFRVGISAEKVAEYVDATGDSAERWRDYAPPGYASALLFVVAPHFLDDPRVKPFTGVLVHVDQTFTWHGPLSVGAEVTVTGTVDRVRERGGSYFVTFAAAVHDAAGDRLLDAVATFLMGEGGAAEAIDERNEPTVWHRGHSQHPTQTEFRAVGGVLPPLDKSASRIDLVKYAAASGDYNPIHFDHGAARHAGLDAIVVHGLLMAAWAMQAIGSTSTRPDPLASIKVRFRNPLYPGEQAVVTGTVKDVAPDAADRQISADVSRGDDKLVTATGVIRLDG